MKTISVLRKTIRHKATDSYITVYADCDEGCSRVFIHLMSFDTFNLVLDIRVISPRWEKPEILKSGGFNSHRDRMYSYDLYLGDSLSIELDTLDKDSRKKILFHTKEKNGKVILVKK